MLGKSRVSSLAAKRQRVLTSLNSETVEHGETLHVEGAAMPQGFRVVSKGGPVIAAAATLTSNTLWTQAMLDQATVVDAQRASEGHHRRELVASVVVGSI
jgi:hypothetical protein